MATICSVGSAVLDRVFILSNLPEPDGGAFIRDRERRGGGVAANVACALAALDHDTAVLSRVGDDRAAEEILGSLREWGVDTGGIHRADGESSYTLVLRGPEGGRMIVAGGDSVPALRLRTPDRERLRAADAVFTSAYAPDRVVRELLDRRRSGSIECLVFDLSGPLPELDGRGTAPETIDGLAAAADLFITNEVAARSYLNAGPKPATRLLREAGAQRVAVTVGAAGAYLTAAAADPVHVPAADCEVLDTTGAGDQFTAALIHAWVFGDASARVAGQMAAHAAAANCTAAGPRGRLATRSDLPGE